MFPIIKLCLTLSAYQTKLASNCLSHGTKRFVMSLSDQLKCISCPEHLLWDSDTHLLREQHIKLRSLSTKTIVSKALVFSALIRCNT
eukprot:1954811-Amphidinium_carterae.1